MSYENSKITKNCIYASYLFLAHVILVNSELSTLFDRRQKLCIYAIYQTKRKKFSLFWWKNCQKRAKIIINYINFQSSRLVSYVFSEISSFFQISVTKFEI